MNELRNSKNDDQLEELLMLTEQMQEELDQKDRTIRELKVQLDESLTLNEKLNSENKTENIQALKNNLRKTKELLQSEKKKTHTAQAMIEECRDKQRQCKIIDYGKYRYELARKEKEARKKQKVIEIKEVRLSPNIDTNDLNTKVGAARKFLEKGDKVKVTLRFRGREMAHMYKSKYILDDFAESLKDIAVIDKPSKVEGRSMVMFLTAKR